MEEFSVRCIINIENWTAWRLKVRMKAQIIVHIDSIHFFNPGRPRPQSLRLHPRRLSSSERGSRLQRDHGRTQTGKKKLKWGSPSRNNGVHFVHRQRRSALGVGWKQCFCGLCPQLTLYNVTCRKNTSPHLCVFRRSEDAVFLPTKTHVRVLKHILVLLRGEEEIKREDRVLPHHCRSKIQFVFFSYGDMMVMVMMMMIFMMAEKILYCSHPSAPSITLPGQPLKMQLFPFSPPFVPYLLPQLSVGRIRVINC